MGIVAAVFLASVIGISDRDTLTVLKKDRHKAKFDMQILAIIKSNGAPLLVTGDGT